MLCGCRIILTISLWTSVISHSYANSEKSKEGIRFENAPYAVRIHENATEGTVVLRIRALDYKKDGSRIPMQIFLATDGSTDIHNFKLDQQRGIIRLNKTIGKPLNSIYTLIAVAGPGTHGFSFEPIRITVSKYNKFTPTFFKTHYDGLVLKSGENGTRILQILSYDNDTEPYNTDTQYEIFQWKNSEYFQIDSDGWISLAKKLEPHIKSVELMIMAFDHGSPPRSAMVKALINVTTISAPEEVDVQQISPVSAKICWQPSRIGNVTGYIVEILMSHTQSLVSRNRIPSSRENIQCWIQYNLTLNETYDITVQGYNNKAVGLLSNVFQLSILQNSCEVWNISCGQGKCEPLRSVLGYICKCQAGFYGLHCEYTDPCIYNPCVHYSKCEVNVTSHDYICTCKDGYYGKICMDFDPCFSGPCLNHGMCTPLSNETYECNCSLGYYGDLCQMFNPCATNPCPIHSNCFNTTDSHFYCECHFGYYEDNCSKFNPCVSSPCLNFGTCYNNSDSNFTCNCTNGFFGEICEFFDPCWDNPCLNDGICTSTEYTASSCVCADGYYGEFCENFNPCSKSPCHNNGTCLNGAPGVFECICQYGYYGSVCENFNPCISNPCLNSALCINITNMEYSCLCSDPYFGRICESFNACHSNPCFNGGKCQLYAENTVFGIRDCRMHCVDGHCSLSTNCTKPQEPAINQPYTCLCKPGYIGNLCEIEIPECKSAPCRNGGTCLRGKDSFVCQCLQGFVGSVCEFEDFCESETVLSDYGIFIWPSVKHGTLYSVPCSYGSLIDDWNDNGYVYRNCEFNIHGAKWSETNTAACKRLDLRSHEKARKIAVEIQNITTKTVHFGSGSMDSIANTLSEIMKFARTDNELSHIMLNTISNLADNNVTDLGSNAIRYVKILESHGAELELPYNKEELVITTKNIDFQVQEIDISSIDSLTFTPSSPGLDMKTNQNLPSITLPQEVFIAANAQKTRGKQRVHFLWYRSGRLFAPSDKQQVDGGVLAASLPGVQITNLKEGVICRLPSTKEDSFSKCVFWNANESYWSTAGIETVSKNGRIITCRSFHLTNFALLFDVDPTVKFGETHESILSIISYVGSGLSLLGLTLTILTYLVFRCLRRDRSGRILLQLSISMLLMNLTFLLGAQKNHMIFEDQCLAVAVLMHYFVFSTLLWMFVEAANMYQMFIQIFNIEERNFLLKRALFCWGIPLIFVSITLGISVDNYRNKNEYCRVSQDNPYVYYILYLGPACMVLLTNLILFLMILRVLLRPRFEHNTGKFNITPTQIRGAFVVMILVGISWLAGIFAIREAKLVFQYVFCITNSIQGFLIFLFRCLLSLEVRSAWLQLFKLGTLKERRGKEVTSGGYSSSAVNSEKHTSKEYLTTKCNSGSDFFRKKWATSNGNDSKDTEPLKKYKSLEVIGNNDSSLLKSEFSDDGFIYEHRRSVDLAKLRDSSRQYSYENLQPLKPSETDEQDQQETDQSYL